MGLLPIMEKGQPVACHTDWPLFYMNDFSRLGLVVSKLAETVQLLKANGYQVLEEGNALLFDKREQLVEAFSLLAEHHIEYEMRDLISCVYQG